MLTIDGSLGEGGGQVLRTSLALAAVTGKPFRIERIRAKRSKRGLLRQHLTAVKAMAEICGARVSGAELGSDVLDFEPGPVRHGEYQFAVGTAGSATLVFQTVLPALLMAAGESRIAFEGGTHNPLAPPFDFIARTFLPQLQRMGATVSAELVRPGFYPAGGGRFEVEIQGGAKLQPLELLERGELQRVSIKAVVSKLSERIAEREMKVLARELAEHPIEVETARVDSAGPGNVASVSVRSAALTETFTAFGEVGLRAEKLARDLAIEVRRYLLSDVPVGEHLADQLLIPCALAGGGALRTSEPSLHTRTNVQVIGMFLPCRVELSQSTRGWLVQVG
ncbi:MAG TPA: RNA 3'-terminal phosphate cyclase [Polyangiales bacterium]|nr:RNA 3'-terminal phosphate cyclase [Polyangiales bacterium]